MKPTPIPDEDLFLQSTLVFLFSSPSPSALRRLLIPLFIPSFLSYFVLYKSFLPGSPTTPITLLIFTLWVTIFFFSVTYDRCVTLPCLVNANILKPSPNEEWFQARTLCSMAECLGFAIGGAYFILGCFVKEETTLCRFFLGSTAVGVAAVIFTTYQRRITWESMKLKGLERPVGLY